MEVHIKKISGNWDLGYVLDKHTISSTFEGYDSNNHAVYNTVRTEVGEATYQLKYKQDWTKVAILSQAIYENILPLFKESIGFVLPMPASNVHPRQPVTEIANAVAELLNVPCFDGILTKTKGLSLKNLETKEEKSQAVANSFSLKDLIENDGTWNVLVIDDLFDSGATMEAACKMLRGYRKVNNIYVATLTWK